MELWLIFAIISVLSLSLSEISQKISLTQKINLSAVTNNFYIWILQGVIGIVLAIILNQFSLNLSTISIIKLVLISIVYFLGGTFFYTSYKTNSPSISIVLGTISVVISSILGNLIFNENYSYKIIIGIVLILSAIVFVNLKKKQKIDKYNIYAIVGGIFYGFAFTIDKSFVIDLSPFMYLGLMCLAVAVVSLIISFKKITRESKKIDVKSTYPMISAAIFGSAFNIFTFFAYRNGGSVGVVDAINNISIFLVIILEIILLKDRKNLFKKILASILAIGGVVLIAIA